MGVDLYITSLLGSPDELIHICPQSDYVNIWQPVCRNLKLELAEISINLPSLRAIPQHRDQMVTELSTLKQWLDVHAADNPRYPLLSERLGIAIDLIANTSLEEFDIGFC